MRVDTRLKKVSDAIEANDAGELRRLLTEEMKPILKVRPSLPVVCLSSQFQCPRDCSVAEL